MDFYESGMKTMEELLEFRGVDHKKYYGDWIKNRKDVDLRKDKAALPSFADMKNRWHARNYYAPGEFNPDLDRYTLQPDSRFQTTTHTKWCHMMYVDFYRCQKKYGQEHKPCNYYAWGAHEICPREWIRKWEEQREAGTFALQHMVDRYEA